MSTITSLSGTLMSLKSTFTTEMVCRWYKAGFLIIVIATKNNVVRGRGETLIVVPYWWDCSEERYSFVMKYNSLFFSLVSTIRFQRPDLLADMLAAPLSHSPASPSPLIPLNQPHSEEGMSLDSYSTLVYLICSRARDYSRSRRANASIF